MPGRQELPSTLRRSPAKARRTWIEAHDSAVEQYGEGVDEQAGRRHLHRIAKELEIPGRSTMSRGQLMDAIRGANRGRTRQKQPSSR